MSRGRSPATAPAGATMTSFSSSGRVTIRQQYVSPSSLEHEGGGPGERQGTSELGFVNLFQGPDPVERDGSRVLPGDRNLFDFDRGPAALSCSRSTGYTPEECRGCRRGAHLGCTARSHDGRTEGQHTWRRSPASVGLPGRDGEAHPPRSLRTRPRQPTPAGGAAGARLRKSSPGRPCLGFDAYTVAESIASHGYFLADTIALDEGDGTFVEGDERFAEEIAVGSRWTQRPCRRQSRARRPALPEAAPAAPPSSGLSGSRRRASMAMSFVSPEVDACWGSSPLGSLPDDDIAAKVSTSSIWAFLGCTPRN